jgi:hypothetical protein
LKLNKPKSKQGTYLGAAVAVKKLKVIEGEFKEVKKEAELLLKLRFV